MLEIVVVCLERAEGNGETHWNIGLQDCTLWEDLKDSHVLTIKAFSFLGDPGERESALEAICDLDIPLTAKSQGLSISEI